MPRWRCVRVLDRQPTGHPEYSAVPDTFGRTWCPECGSQGREPA